MITEPRSVFVGRLQELAALQELLEVAPLVTLTGVGGTGKTRLALRAANTHAEAAGVDCWFVPLESVQDPQRLPRAVVRALRLADQSARDPLDVVVDALRDRPAVLVVDNCEHIIDAAAGFIDELLLALPQLTVLATSRRRLELDGERVFAVPPLSVDPASGDLPDAVSLLISRAQAREREVAMRIHRGMSNRDIAEELVLSVRTVDTHVQRILGKLGFTSRAQIAVWYEAMLVTASEIT